MATLLVPHEPTSAARVRHALLADLAGHPISPESTEEVVLVASELVGNAIRHTSPAQSGDLTVSWQIQDDSVMVQVSDSSQEPPRRRKAHVDEPDGRGLTIVAVLASDWGTDRHASGKHVWARVPIRTTDSVARYRVGAH